MARSETSGTASQTCAKLWRAIRMKRSAIRACDLAALSGAKRTTVLRYLRALAASGYLSQQGRVGQRYIYSLIRDSGPIAPRADRNGSRITLDPNLEIAAMRSRHAELLTEIRKIETRITRLGAYVEKFNTAGNAILPNGGFKARKEASK